MSHAATAPGDTKRIIRIYEGHFLQGQQAYKSLHAPVFGAKIEKHRSSGVTKVKRLRQYSRYLIFYVPECVYKIDNLEND